MRILGISAYYHDSAAALVEDGRIIAAVQEERFTRKKHDASFPTNAVSYCLDAAGAKLGDIGRKLRIVVAELAQLLIVMFVDFGLDRVRARQRRLFRHQGCRCSQRKTGDVP